MTKRTYKSSEAAEPQASSTQVISRPSKKVGRGKQAHPQPRGWREREGKF
jgi:hypothetical protein